jgi:hypothetical protein
MRSTGGVMINRRDARSSADAVHLRHCIKVLISAQDRKPMLHCEGRDPGIIGWNRPRPKRFSAPRSAAEGIVVSTVTARRSKWRGGLEATLHSSSDVWKTLMISKFAKNNDGNCTLRGPDCPDHRLTIDERESAFVSRNATQTIAVEQRRARIRAFNGSHKRFNAAD